jgi:hypothetical protein
LLKYDTIKFVMYFSPQISSLLLLLLLLLYNIYIAHYITITLSTSHYKTIKIIQDTN